MSQGPTGPQGPTGITGPQGPAGVKGPKGPNGERWMGYSIEGIEALLYGQATGPTGTMGFFQGTETINSSPFDLSYASSGKLYITNAEFITISNSSPLTSGAHFTFVNPSLVTHRLEGGAYPCPLINGSNNWYDLEPNGFVRFIYYYESGSGSNTFLLFVA